MHVVLPCVWLLLVCLISLCLAKCETERRLYLHVQKKYHDDKDKGEVKVEDQDEDYDEFELTMEDPTESRNSVWSEDGKTSKSFLSSSMKGIKGNQQFREFMQESFAKLPSVIATRMTRPDGRPQGRKGRVSYLDRNSAPLVNVPIVDNP